MVVSFDWLTARSNFQVVFHLIGQTIRMLPVVWRGLDQGLWPLRRHGSPDRAPKLVWLAGQIDGRSSVVFQFSWFGATVLKPILKRIKTNKQALAKRLLHYNFKTSHSFHCEHALTKRVCQFDAAVYDEANFECSLAGIFTFIWRLTV